MHKRRPAHFRNSIDLKDKVEVRTLRKRLKLSPDDFAGVVRKTGPSIAAISKEAGWLERPAWQSGSRRNRTL